jgi:hypothetical protein
MSSWLQAWQERHAIVNTQKYNSHYSSVLDTFLNHQIGHSKQRVILLFSDFLTLDAAQKQQLVWLDSQHIVAQIMIDVPQVVGRNFIVV